MVYGLTKGQASPTSQIGFKTPVQIKGVFLEPFNPLALAVALDASFVARAFSGDIEQTKEILKEAISHKGFALVDIFQPCVTFNKVNTHKWFKENTYYLDKSYDPLNRAAAFQKAVEREKLPLGIFYRNDKKSTFEENVGVYRQNKEPLALRKLERKNKLSDLIKSKR
jgi:2-oxoglutarate ferredoxin oxidoreductase subunit beta